VNCPVASNTAVLGGGGTSGGRALNSIVYFNHILVAITTRTNHDGGFFTNSCTTPLPTFSVNVVTNPPLLQDLAGGDLRLNPGSPSVNAGNNSFTSEPTDMDGNPRVVGGAVDLGAYELIGPVLTTPRLLTNGVFTSVLMGATNWSYAIEYSTNLAHWTGLTILSNTAGVMPFEDTDASNSVRRYYRARVLP
jgi:hypothetical protein